MSSMGNHLCVITKWGDFSLKLGRLIKRWKWFDIIDEQQQVNR